MREGERCKIVLTPTSASARCSACIPAPIQVSTAESSAFICQLRLEGADAAKVAGFAGVGATQNV
jgi:hypothetical protein